MARPEELVRGNCYFKVTYYDDKLILPSIDTMVFVEEHQDPEEGRLWIFREPPSPVPASAIEAGAPEEDEPIFVGFSDNQLHEVLDFDALLITLAAVAPDHPIDKTIAPVTLGVAEQEAAKLQPAIEAFLADDRVYAVGATICFTNDGVHLSHENDGTLSMTFYVQSPAPPDQGARIIQFFRDRGVEAHCDRFGNGRRTRILAFATPRDAAEIATVFEQVLRDVFRMRSTDTLRISFTERHPKAPAQ
jgi:hypothetical protein